MVRYYTSLTKYDFFARSLKAGMRSLNDSILGAPLRGPKNSIPTVMAFMNLQTRRYRDWCSRSMVKLSCPFVVPSTLSIRICLITHFRLRGAFFFVQISAIRLFLGFPSGPLTTIIRAKPFYVSHMHGSHTARRGLASQACTIIGPSLTSEPAVPGS